MKVYLLRHAEAERLEPDEARPLTPQGEKGVKDLGRFLRKRGIADFEEVWHSPLIRARQTAETLAHKLKRRIDLQEEPLLVPDADPIALARKLDEARGDILLVGHNPHLEGLAAYLACGDPKRPLVDLKKCGMIALQRSALSAESEQRSGWLIRWMIVPKLLG